MATTPRHRPKREIDYPTSDGRPMAESDIHRQGMVDLIDVLKDRFEADPSVYVSGNLLVFYEEGNRRKHVAPDVFVVRGVPKLPLRDHYLMWREGKGPDVVIELTSKTTRAEDQRKKLGLYRDVIHVPEYFLFDPFEDWLRPAMQGYRLVEGAYVPIEPVDGRLHSDVLGIHLGREGVELRLYDPETGRRLPTLLEQIAEAQEARRQLEEETLLLEARRCEIEAEIEQLRRETEVLRRGGA